jgi:hypothetical protein
VWRDEVMSDVVADLPRKITVGHKGKPTFIVPEIPGLPAEFAIISPGNRGYLLTLNRGMRGKICIDGHEQDVKDFVAKSDGFSATPISGKDWGVIELDASGEFKLFFSFVPVEVPIHSNAELFTTLTVTAAIALLGMLAIVVGWSFFQEDYYTPTLGEWSMRSVGLIICGLLIFGGAFSLATTDPESQASTGFSIILHGSLLIGTYVVYKQVRGSDEWPGPRAALTSGYMVSRLQEAEKIEIAKIEIGTKKDADAAPKDKAPPQKLPAAAKRDEGAAGGKGDTERAIDPKARDNERLAAVDNTVFSGKNMKYINNVTSQVTSNLGKFTGMTGDTLRAGSMGFGPGDGTGVGVGNGTGTTRGSKKTGRGGGGQAEGEFEHSKGPKTGTMRAGGGNCVGENCKGIAPKAVAVVGGSIGGDTGGYTEEEINRVVRGRSGVFRACYQKELNRSPGIGGKVVVKFKIGPDGRVISAVPTGASSLSNEAVQSCVAANVARLAFPPKGAIANVTYPFLFSPGG